MIPEWDGHVKSRFRPLVYQYPAVDRRRHYGFPAPSLRLISYQSCRSSVVEIDWGDFNSATSLHTNLYSLAVFTNLMKFKQGFTASGLNSVWHYNVIYLIHPWFFSSSLKSTYYLISPSSNIERMIFGLRKVLGVKSLIKATTAFLVHYCHMTTHSR